MKVISLDFWGTVGVFNPNYSRARTELLARVMNCEPEEADKRYKRQKESLDNSALVHGMAATPLECVAKLLFKERYEHEGFNCAAVVAQLEALVLRHPPIISPHMIGAIMDLKHDGYVIGLASNTNFIRGDLILNIYSDLNALIDFAVHSDAVGVSKPHPEFFNTVIERARYAAQSDVPASEMLHIGDHEVCDIMGAERAGMMARLTHSPEETITILSCLPDITKSVTA